MDAIARNRWTISPEYAPRGAGGEGFVWFYDLTADGFSLDDKRTPMEANDIPDVLAKWPERAEGHAPSSRGSSYRVPLAKIMESDDFSLAAGRYKPVTAQATNHDKPKDILAEGLAMEEEITGRARKLMEAIGK